jgi:hypothetical protein
VNQVDLAILDSKAADKPSETLQVCDEALALKSDDVIALGLKGDAPTLWWHSGGKSVASTKDIQTETLIMRGF